MKRRDARESAFILIFEKTFRSEDMDELIEISKDCGALQLDDYSIKLAKSVAENWDSLDKEISPFLSNWRLERLSRVSASLLRLAFFEMSHFDDIPTSVTINEAVEIAKKYGTKDDASYINGVLGSYSKVLQRSDDSDSVKANSEDASK